MSLRSRWLGATAGFALAFGLVATAAPAARADGDPASDVLVAESIFYPYSSPVSAPVRAALERTVQRAASAGFAVKVALIDSPIDLGAIPSLFGAPQRYATFLETEIAYNVVPRLIVVMPQGIGLAHAGSRAALAGIAVDPRAGSDGLAESAIAAITALADRAGRPVPKPNLRALGQGNGGGSSWLPFALIGLAALGGAALAFGVRRRHLLARRAPSS